MSEKNFYDVLRERSTDTHQQDVDGVAACIRAITSNLDALHPNLQVPFKKLAEQMTTHLDRLRLSRYNAYDYFSGKGIVARKLAEYIKMDDWLNPTHRARNADAIRNIDLAFNKFPTRDELEIKELQDFIQLTLPLMQGQVDGQEFKDISPTESLMGLETGFYAINMPSGLKRPLMLLRAHIKTINVFVVYVLEMGQEEMLVLHHPEEGEWFRCDYTFTFSSLVSNLRSELHALIEPLGFTVEARPLNEQLDEVFQKADFFFDNHARIPSTGLQFVTHRADQTYVTIPIGDYYQWNMVDTRGTYPSRYKKFQIKMGSHFQSVLPEDMNEFSRQNMVKSLHMVFDQLIGALAPAVATERSNGLVEDAS